MELIKRMEKEMTVKQLIKQLEELDVGEDATVKVYEYDAGDGGFNTLVPAGDVTVHEFHLGESVPEFVVIW